MCVYKDVVSEKTHKQLPSWLRDGLEKIKQEKQKKLETAAAPTPPVKKPNEAAPALTKLVSSSSNRGFGDAIFSNRFIRLNQVKAKCLRARRRRRGRSRRRNL